MCEVDNDSNLRAVVLSPSRNFYLLGFENGELQGIYVDETF